jgi:regulator of RNase E activity RraA
MGAAPGHNFGGDNIAAGIYGATGTGSVVFGTIRDLEGTYELPLQIYFKGPHPSAVSGVNVIGINIPIRVGDAMVMPGDVVLGDRTGVVFIPPHIAEEVVDRADEVHIHDEWTKEKLLTGKYKTSELYGGPLSPEHQKEYEEYKKRKMEELAAKRRK